MLAAINAEPAVDAAVIVLPWDADRVARPAAQHLRAQLDVSSRVVTTTLALDTAELMRIARASWPERWAIVLDPARARVTVLRPADGTILIRAIDPSLANDAPYAVALTALQLFAVAREVKGSTVINEAETRLGRANRMLPSIAVDAALAITASPDHEVTLAQPMIGASLVLRGTETSWWTAFGLRTRVLGARDTTLSGSASDVLLHYERLDASLRVMLGRKSDPFDFALAIEGGGSRAGITAKNLEGATIAEDDRWTWWGGGGLEGRLELINGLSLSLGTTILFVPQPARYRVRDDVYSEGSLRLSGSLGLVWELG